MKITLSFAELSEYIKNHYSKSVNFAKAADDIVTVTYEQPFLFGKSLPIALNLKIEEVRPDAVTVSYDGKIPGMDLIIAGLVKAAKSILPTVNENMGEITEAIVAGEGHRLTVELSRLRRTKALVEAVSLTGIRFLEDALTITATLK